MGRGLDRLHRITLLGAVMLSGGAGLMYQVAWTRRVASVTSVTVTAQAVVLGIFMAGLGCGALLAGRRARALARPLLAYAAVEVGAAALASVSIPLIAWSDALRSGAAALGADPGIGLWVQLLTLSAFLLLPAALMGASIPFVIEAIERHGLGVERSARTISAVYAINTLGAAAGCLAAGFVTVEAFGLLRTTLVGAGSALAAAALAALLERKGGGSPGPVEHDDLRAARSGALAGWWQAAAVAGFIGLGIEVVWTRLISLVVLNTVYAFTQVLASVLLGIALGAGLAVPWIRRAHRTSDPELALARTAGRIALLAALLFALLPGAIVDLAGASEVQLELASGLSWRGNGLLLLLLCPPSALVAALLPLLVAVARARARGSESFALLYGANTAGSVAGSTVAGFVLLPRLGSTGSNAALVALTLALSAWLLSRPGLAAGRALAGRLAFGTTAAVAVGLALAADLPRAVYEARLDEGTRILGFREGVQSDVMVTEDAKGVRRIWINSSWVAGTGGGHRSLGHVPALLVAKPRRALGIALGTGQTFASVYKHGIERLDCVELDAGVIELSTRWFAEANDHLFERPRVTLHRDDGRAFLRGTRERFDLIVLEPLQAWSAGTSNLYSKEFYEDAKAALAPGGVLAQWIPFYGQGVDETRAMVRAAREIFPEASLWLDDHDGILVLQAEPFALDPEAIRERVAERGLAAELARNSFAETEDLLSLFVMGPEGLDAWQRGAPLLTDDRPFLEFAAARDLGQHAYQAILQSMSERLDPPLRYLRPGGSGDGRERAARSARIRAAILGERALPREQLQLRAESLEAVLASTPSSRLARRRYRNLVLEWATGLERSGRAEEAEAVYRRGLSHHPELGEAAVNLSLLYARQKRYELAQQALDRPWQPGPVRDSALRARALVDAALHAEGARSGRSRE